MPFLDYDVEIRKVICCTNAIESINARYRRAVRARGHFPSDQAALKCLYLVTRSLDPTGKGKARWAMKAETRPERVRHHLRGPDPHPMNTTDQIRSTVYLIDPPLATAVMGHSSWGGQRRHGSDTRIGQLTADSRST